MATSGSWDYSLTAAQIIASAYEDLGVISPGGTVSTANSTMALTRLNMIVKQYQGTSDGAPGVKVHTRQRITLFMAKGQQSYTVGSASTDARATTLFGRTTLSASAIASATTISIASNTDLTSFPGTTVTMTASDFIGIQLSDGTIHWTTISGTPTTTATLVTGLASAASSGAYVWWFTTRSQRFPTLETATLRDSNYRDSPLEVYSEIDQYELGVSNKFADGTPTALLCEPLRQQTRITLNSKPTDVSKQIYLTVLYPSEDYDSTSNDIAFPQEALRFLSWELAFALSPAVGRWTPEMEQNRKEARQMYLNLNPENSVMYFQPNG
jgi:hypothetical protein